MTTTITAIDIIVVAVAIVIVVERRRCGGARGVGTRYLPVPIQSTWIESSNAASAAAYTTTHTNCATTTDMTMCIIGCVRRLYSNGG